MAKKLENKANKKGQKSDFRKIVKWFWLLVLSLPVFLFLLLFVTWAGAFGQLPSIKEIANPQTKLASQIISLDGQLMGKFFNENRTNASYEDLSPHLINALVGTEDERYYSHSGLDIKRLITATIALGTRGGASTITQQLAKMQFSQHASSKLERLTQKLKEWIIAVQLERQYTKEEIIVLYYNKFDFLYQAVGINSASRIYFDTTPGEITLEQAAVFVGMAKNPSLYNPKKDSARATGRRNQVFIQMYKNDYLTKDELDSLKLLPLEITFQRQGHDKGTAQYFREYVRSFMKKWVKANPKATGEEYNIYRDGLKIYTTIDSRMQAYAEAAVTSHMKNVQKAMFKYEARRGSKAPFHFKVASDYETQIPRILKQSMVRTQRYQGMKNAGRTKDEIETAFNKPVKMHVFGWNGEIDTVMTPLDSIRYYKYFYRAGLLSVEPQTGFVKAWVGGINYKYFKYDHVYQGRRQVGSTFKPFVYATAIIEKGYSPCMEVPNVKTCIEKGMYGLQDDWCPSNANGKYGGMLSLKEGLARSKNTITTYLMKQVGPGPVIELAQKMGIRGEVPKQPSIALGAVDLSLYEMVGSYTTFANKGIYTKPMAILRIEDKNGVVLADFSPKTKEVMSEEDAYVILDLLKGVTLKGTGVRLRTSGAHYPENIATGYPYGFTNEIAGKTGTTQMNSDGWFMGVVPNLVTGVWAGCEDRSVHFSGTGLGQGASVALPIWGMYMRDCYNNEDLGISKAPFELPQNPISIDIDCRLFDDEEEEVKEPEPEF